MTKTQIVQVLKHLRENPNAPLNDADKQFLLSEHYITRRFRGFQLTNAAYELLMEDLTARNVCFRPNLSTVENTQ